MYSCFDVAKKFLDLAKKEGKLIQPMKLLKLTYIAHGWHLAFFNKPLFGNEIQAWQYGPVIPSLYHTIKIYGTRDVKYDFLDIYIENELSSESSKFIEVIWNAYKNFNGLQLSSKTHQAGTPWDKVYDGSYHRLMSNNVIGEYYKNLKKEWESNAARS